jgi:hypothetical protein
MRPTARLYISGSFRTDWPHPSPNAPNQSCNRHARPYRARLPHRDRLRDTPELKLQSDTNDEVNVDTEVERVPDFRVVAGSWRNLVDNNGILRCLWLSCKNNASWTDTEGGRRATFFKKRDFVRHVRELHKASSTPSAKSSVASRRRPMTTEELNGYNSAENSKANMESSGK